MMMIMMICCLTSCSIEITQEIVLRGNRIHQPCIEYCSHLWAGVSLFYPVLIVSFASLAIPLLLWTVFNEDRFELSIVRIFQMGLALQRDVHSINACYLFSSQSQRVTLISNCYVKVFLGKRVLTNTQGKDKEQYPDLKKCICKCRFCIIFCHPFGFIEL